MIEPPIRPAEELPMVSMPNAARPRMSGRPIVLFAAKSAAAVAPRPLGSTGQTVSASACQRKRNRACVSALARSVAPDVALPMVRALQRTAPARVPFIGLHQVSPVLSTVVGSTPDPPPLAPGDRIG